jgi:TM2 domain-containing membrane protein YozV
MNNIMKFSSVLLFLVLQEIFFFKESSCQTDSAKEINIYSPQNILAFADFLFSQHDYLRAVTEYENYLLSSSNDTVKFKIALSFLNMEQYKEAENKFSELMINPKLAIPSRLEIAKSVFQRKDFPYLESYYKKNEANENSRQSEIKSLYYFSLLYQQINLPDEYEFINTFPNSIRTSLKEFYLKKKDLPHRSPIIAGVLSAIIPGAGKIYTGEYSDGITAAILTGLLTFLSYDNFNHNHKFRGWLWSGLAAFFYAGNIYGSAASAQIYNARINFVFTNELDLFIRKNNYLLPQYDFISK